MDIVERLRQEIGGYTDTDIEKAEADMKEAAAEIEDLRIKVKILEMDYRNSIQESLILGDAWKSGVDEIERLRQLNEEWREAVLDLRGYIFSADWMFVSDKTKAAYTKAVEG